MNIFRLINKIIWKFLYLKNNLLLLPAYVKLRKNKKFQKDKYKILKNKCTRYYINLLSEDFSEFMTSPWKNFNKKMGKIILPEPCFSFLRNRNILQTMFVKLGGKWINKELLFLEKKVSQEKLKTILEEDYIGNPILANSKYLTSHNSIHHLYHLIYFQEKSKVNLNKIKTVVEWGGGYGNMAKIFQRLLPKTTYIIIDLPLFSCIQWLYLAVIFGEEKVNFLNGQNKKIEEGKINILPICFLKNYNLNAELFIATWSLSESSRYAQDYVNSLNFFNTKHFLLAFQEGGGKLPHAGRIKEIALFQGGKIRPIEFSPGNYYAFK